MNTPLFNNARDVLINAIATIINEGQRLESRLGECIEISPYSFTLTHPSHRLILLKSFHEDILTKLISSIWLVTGTNDITLLQPYLPQATSRSDDGYTWRSAAGSRLRNWDGIDQLYKVVEILKNNPESRRAVCTLFNPLYDLTPSKDIATTTSIQFMIRHNKLEMFVNMRSIDVINGLGAVNIFEWTMLQELAASWLDKEVGHFHFYTSSLHLYEADYSTADKILTSQDPTNLQSGVTVKWNTPQDLLDAKLEQFWNYEAKLRARHECDYTDIEDDFLAHVLNLIKHACSNNDAPITDSLWMSALESHGIHIE